MWISKDWGKEIHFSVIFHFSPRCPSFPSYTFSMWRISRRGLHHFEGPGSIFPEDRNKPGREDGRLSSVLPPWRPCSGGLRGLLLETMWGSQELKATQLVRRTETQSQVFPDSAWYFFHSHSASLAKSEWRWWDLSLLWSLSEIQPSKDHSLISFQYLNIEAAFHCTRHIIHHSLWSIKITGLEVSRSMFSSCHCH